MDVLAFFESPSNIGKDDTSSIDEKLESLMVRITVHTTLKSLMQIGTFPNQNQYIMLVNGDQGKLHSLCGLGRIKI